MVQDKEYIFKNQEQEFKKVKRQIDKLINNFTNES